MAPTREETERSRARLGLAGGVARAAPAGGFQFSFEEPEAEQGALARALGFINEVDKPLIDRAAERFGFEDPGGPVGFVLDELTRPSTLAIAAFGAGLATKLAATGIRGTGLAANLIAPRGTSLATRFAITGAENVGGRAAAEGVNRLVPEGAPAPVRIGAGLAGGILGAGVGAGALSRGARSAVGRDLFAAPDFSTGARIGAQPEREIDRVGIMLSAPTMRELGPDTTVDDIIPHTTFNLRGRTVAENLQRQVEGKTELTLAEADLALRQLGQAKQGADRNWYLEGVQRADGAPALLTEVLEYGTTRFPSLTPDQVRAVEAYQVLNNRPSAERAEFGVPVVEADLEQGQGFVTRMRRPETQAEASRGRGVKPLAVGKDKHRIYNDPAEAIANGVVYEHPLVALERYTRTSLEKATGAHVADLLKQVGENPLDSPSIRSLMEQTRVVNSKARSARATLIRQGARRGEQRLAANRATRNAEVRGERVTAAGVRLAAKQENFSAEDLRQASEEINTAFFEGRRVSREIGENAERLRQAGRTLSSEQQAIVRQAEKLDEALAEAEGYALGAGRAAAASERTAASGVVAAASGADVGTSLPRARLEQSGAQALAGEYTRKLRDADRIERLIYRLEDRSAKFADDVDALAERGEILGDLDTATRQSFVNARRAERGQRRMDRVIASAERELRMLEREATRAQTTARHAGGRAGSTAAKEGATGVRYDALREELRDLKNKLTVAKAAALSPPQGRAFVDRNKAPALQAFHFEEGSAERITRYYSRGELPKTAIGTTVRAINGVNRALVPMRAMLDASSVLNQLAAIAPTNPLTFLKNVAISFGDAAGDGTKYAQFLATQGQDAASHGVVILGHGRNQVDILGRAANGAASDFQFPTWFHRAPVIGQLATRLQRQFEAVTTRNRVDIYNQFVDVAAKRGQPLDDIAKEEVGRSLNRLSGISNSGANDVETLVEFAPRFLRSSFEVVDVAFREGNLEGQIARQYMRNLIIAGQIMVIGTAAAQGRDLREVTSPIDLKAAERGELRMNPNFGTVRLYGQDVSVYGRFDSLARLGVVALDAGARAIADRDPIQIFDAIGFAARSKGSPAVGAAGDLIQGSTFTGNDPFSGRALMESVTPFTIQAFMQDYRDSQNLPVTMAGGAVSFFGGKSNPLTPFEQLNEASQQRYGRAVDDLTGQERQELRETLPGLADRADRETARRADQGDDKARARVEFDAITEQRITGERALMQAFQVGEIDAQQLGNALSELQFKAATERDQTMTVLDVQFDDSRNPAKQALDAWFQTFKDAEVAPGVKDFEQRELLEADLFRQIAQGAYGDPAEAMRQITDRASVEHAPEVDWFYQAKDTINQAGYYELQDEVFARYAEAASRITGGHTQTYGDLVRALNVAEQEGNAQGARALGVIRNRIDSETQRQRLVLRLQNPDLDAALVQARGLVPARQAAARR